MNQKASILIIDDDESTRRSLTLIFNKKGYEVETAGTGREALEQVQGRSFNVALLDIRLPDIEGVELVAPLKEMAPDMVVIMITAHASLESVVRAMNEGASAYITKPFNMDEVLVTLEQVLEKQHLVMENKRLLQEVQRELAERKRVEEQLKASLREKEVLLKEIHHRVKNNLQIVHSLLDLQAGHIQDEQARQAFQESQSRIRSMALIHERLYQAQDLARVDFAEYIESLANYLLAAYGAASISLQINVSDVFLSLKTAIPCGLIINELVSNALRHAFPLPLSSPPHGKGTERGCKIRIELQADDQQLTLLLTDNGAGFPPEVDFRRTKSLGLTLVMTLIKQLEGTIELRRERGTEFKITFTDVMAKVGS